MRKLLFFMLVTLDGYFEGPNHDISWHNVDEEFNDFAIDQLDEVGMLLFGRETYELMAQFWPSPEAMRDDPQTAERMNKLPKIVFSQTLDKAAWQNTRLVKKDAVAEIRKLKDEPGKDLIILGSSNLAVSLIGEKLIDEFRILVNPLALGKGTALFQGISQRLDLHLLRTRVFQSGNILLVYQPA